MNRREFAAASVGGSGALLAGCLESVESLFETDARGGEPPVVDDRPDAVYYPTHVEGMETVAMARAGPYTVALAYSFPHRFWTVTGRTAERVSVGDDDSIHLMLSVWDADTEVVVPVASQSVELRRNGEVVDQRSLWPMLSQSMGYHFGDNVALSAEGTYRTTIRIGPVDARRTGAFADRFDEPVSLDVEFEYDRDALDDLRFEELEDRKGEPGAVDPMEMEMMALAETPRREALPGEVIGESTSGDAVFVCTTIDDAGRFDVDDGRTYLAVSPRTPYNRFPLPFMSLGATVSRDGEAPFDGPLRAGLDPELGYHYGTAVDRLESADTIAITVDSPPQVSRHEGYETAFLEMSPMELTVE